MPAPGYWLLLAHEHGVSRMHVSTLTGARHESGPYLKRKWYVTYFLKAQDNYYLLPIRITPENIMKR
jgi:hypothetical protein